MENSPALITSAPPKKPTRWQFYLAAVLTLGFLVYFFQPAVSTWFLRRHLTSKAEAAGAAVSFSKVEADLFTGHILLNGMQLHSLSRPTNLVTSEEVQVDFSLWRLLFRRELSPVKKITVGTTQVDWKWDSKPGQQGVKQGSGKFYNRFPAAFIGNGISARLEWGISKTDIANADFAFTPNVAGVIDIPRMAASIGSWKRVFNNLEGVTAIKDRALYVSGIKFTPNLVLERGALDFTDPNKRQITSDLLFSAFGGQCRTDFNLDGQKSPFELDTAASFWNLSVKQLGEFVGNDTLAEGTIHEGRLTFHGSPSNLAKSTTTLRLNATDFRWHERRWNSLIASGLLVNRRVEIPQFDLVQDKNQVQIKGHVGFPIRWNQIPADFQLQVLAQIDDLHSASLLLLPNEKGISGEAFFAGEVRNQNGKFSGNLKMRGGPLEISGVKVDRARGDLDLQGSEVRAKSLELVRRDDKAAGWATIDLAAPRRYSGEFEVTAGNMADYAAILPKVVADHAASGGVQFWWSGDGTNQAHSGAFKVNLRDFLISPGKDAVPLDVEAHGSYSPAGITLNELMLQRPNTQLNAAIIVRPESMEIRDLRVKGSGGAEVSGNLVLPINLLSALDNPTLASLLDSKASATGQIVGTRIRLDELCELAGRRQKLRGRTTFSLAAEGPLDALKSELKFSVEDFFATNLEISTLKANVQLAENQFKLHSEMNSGAPQDEMTIELAAKTALSQQNLALGKWLDEEAPLSGTIKWTRFTWQTIHPWWIPARALSGSASASLTIGGSAKNPSFEGPITLQNTDWQPDWLNYPLQKLAGTVSLSKDSVSYENVSGNYRKGSFKANGTSGTNPRDPLNLQIEGKDITLSSDNDASEAVVSGAVQLFDTDGTRMIKGPILLQDALLHRELRIISSEVALPAISRFSLPWIAPEWKLDLEVTAQHPIEIRGNDQTWLAEPKWTLRETAGTPLISGSLKLRPMALTQNAAEDTKDTVVSFQNSTLENGVVENPEPIVEKSFGPLPLAELPLQPVTAPPEMPKRLEILPVLENPPKKI